MGKPRDVRVNNCKLILKNNRIADGKVDVFIARIVICGNQDDVSIIHTVTPGFYFILLLLELC